MVTKQEVVGVFCSLPQQPHSIVSVPAFQRAYSESKNKGQRLRACLRTLSSMGYLVGMYDQKEVKEFIEDYQD